MLSHFRILWLALGGSCGPFLFAGTPLPEGHQGIAAHYPGDAGIERHADVLFVESFDLRDTAQLKERWETVDGLAGMSFSTLTPRGSRSSRSLLITHEGGKGTGGQLYRRLPGDLQKVFARWYVRFDQDCWDIHHFGTHLGGFAPSTPWPQGGAGERPDGHKRFTSGVEPYGRNWTWDFYTYWQGMRRHGDGNFWGTPFLEGITKPKAEKGKWVCVEMMMELNSSPEKKDGAQCFWLDGQLIRQDHQIVSHVGPGQPAGSWKGGWWAPSAAASTTFEGFQWSSSESLGINYLWTYLYITQAPKGHISRVWFDQIVVASTYIGPISS